MSIRAAESPILRGLEAGLPVAKPWPQARPAQELPQLPASSQFVRTQPPRFAETFRSLSDTAGRIARQQKFTAAINFWAKAVRDPTALATWIEFVIEHHHEHAALPPNTRVLRKPQRNYGCTGRTVRERVEALTAHYEFAAAHLSAKTHRELLSGGQVHLARIDARDTCFDLCLGSSLPNGQKQEGELTVLFSNKAGLPLARMGFAFGRDADGVPIVLIGGLQGLLAGADKRLIVQATRTLSGLRPKDAALVGVQAVARAFGIKRVLAVSNGTHVLAAEWFMSDSVISRDYDGFWEERGGQRDGRIGYVLPVRDYRARVAASANPRLIDRHRADLSDRAAANLVRR